MRAVIIATLLLSSGCEAPAPLLEASCAPRCITEVSEKIAANDLLYKSPGVWRFFDDYAQTLGPECTSDAGQGPNLVPLWRHTINPLIETDPQQRSGRFGGRGAIAVHPNGQVVVALGATVWFFDGRTGTPQHVLLAPNAPRPDRLIHFEGTGVAAFTPDGGGLWVAANAHPALLDLTDWHRRDGPRVTFVWSDRYEDDTWNDLSQAVGSDGTLFWRSFTGKVRALETDGDVRWTLPPWLDGTPRVDANDFVYWSNGPARAFAASSGQEVWRPEQWPGWETAELTNSENAPIGALIPVMHNAPTQWGALSLHRNDGSVAGIITGVMDGGLSFFPDSTAQSQNTLFSAAHHHRNSANEEVGLIEAFDQSTLERKWSTEFKPLATDPLAVSDDALYVATRDCQLSLVDRNGQIQKSHRMAGRPTGDLMQVQNGILYVLTELNSGLSSGQTVFPGDFTVPREDGGVSSIADYQCLASSKLLCGMPIRGDNPFLYMLYAFAVE